MQPKIYLVSHNDAYKAFEDYCQGLLLTLPNVSIIVFCDESEIPVTDDRYFFLSYIPPKFYKRYLSGKHSQLHLINTEQSTRPVWTLMLQHYSNHKIKIYDYDFYQAKTRAEQTKEQICYLPYQISDKEDHYLTNLVKESPKYYNVAICSVNASKRRANIFRLLQQQGIKVIDVSGWKESRDLLIAQSQILLNIHYDNDYQIFEHFRCDRWILTGMLTVSEKSLSDDLLDFKDLLIIENYDRLIEKIIEIVANYKHYQELYLKKLFSVKNQIICDRKKLVMKT